MALVFNFQRIVRSRASVVASASVEVFRSEERGVGKGCRALRGALQYERSAVATKKQ